MARRKTRKVTVGLVKVMAAWARPERNLKLLEDVTEGLGSAGLDGPAPARVRSLVISPRR
jgi:hypothetical protein